MARQVKAPPAEPGDYGQGERDRQDFGARQRLRVVAFGPRSRSWTEPARRSDCSGSS